MTRISTLVTITALAAALPVHAGDAQDITNAFNLFSTGRYLDARDAARDYLRVYGPRFSAAFIVAASECQLHPHRRANRAAFVALNVDYVLSDAKKTAVDKWISTCTSPPPPPLPPPVDGIGVSVAGLTVPPPRDPARPTRNEPAPRARPIRTETMVTSAMRTGTVVAVLPPADRCIDGYVWRDAFAGDHVCVTPGRRTQVAEDNQAAASRVDPNGAYGPQTCVDGFVWREARVGDTVCVSPFRRQSAADDNSHATERRVR